MAFGNEDWPSGFVKGKRRTINNPAILFKDAAGNVIGKMVPIGRADYMGQAIGQVPRAFYKESSLFMALTCYGYAGRPDLGAAHYAFGPEWAERVASVTWLRGGATIEESRQAYARQVESEPARLRNGNLFPNRHILFDPDTMPLGSIRRLPESVRELTRARPCFG